MSLEERLKELKRRDNEAMVGGGRERIEKQHAAGKLTARERVELLFDRNTFEEVDRFVVHRCDNFGMEKSKIIGDTSLGSAESELGIYLVEEKELSTCPAGFSYSFYHWDAGLDYQSVSKVWHPGGLAVFGRKTPAEVATFQILNPEDCSRYDLIKLGDWKQELSEAVWFPE